MRDVTEDFDFLILPGIRNSGINHWQSYWCLAFRNATRVLQDDWDAPTLPEWLERLEIAILDGTRPTVLICHSLSCSLAAHWAKRNRPGRVAAAFLVSPTDVNLPEHLATVRDFAPMPLAKFPVPTLVVASANDPYVTLPRAKEFAENWGADFGFVGELGHVNADSRLGFWPQGLLMLGQLLARAMR